MPLFLQLDNAEQQQCGIREPVAADAHRPRQHRNELIAEREVVFAGFAAEIDRPDGDPIARG